MVPMDSAGSHAVVIERNKLVGRRVARVLASAGMVAEPREEPPAELPVGTWLVVADAFDTRLVGRWLAESPSLRAILYAAPDTDQALAERLELALTAPGLAALVGRASFEEAPLAADLLLVA